MNDGYIRKVLPDPSLRDYIRQYTFIDIPFEQTRQMEFKVMPSSHARMILFLGEPSLHEMKNMLQPVDRYSLTGFVSKPHLFVPTSTLQQVMVHFTAWGIQPFVAFPLSEITDTRADLNYIFGRDLDNLCTGLHRGVALHDKVFALDQFFKYRLRKLPQIDERAKALTRYILQINGTVRLQDLCKNLYIGERTAQRLIHNTIGVNYKFFTRLVRLEYVRRLMAHENISLTDVAIQAGYFDQAHFIHDFQTSFDESPREYLKRHQKLIWNKIEP
jgi:AraC-like DNA-binding protein